ncbi:Altered inheritance of mitochondria protein 6 [Clarireedia jacksonii]
MAETTNLSSIRHSYDDATADSDYDSSNSIDGGSSMEMALKHPPSFDYSNTNTLEDGYINRRSNARSTRSWWSRIMTVRSRRRQSLEDFRRKEDGDGDSGRGLLTGTSHRRPRQIKNALFNYLVFGGISGLGILCILLLINLALGIATMIWFGDVDTALRNWGKPGTGTEDLAWYPTDFTRDINPIPCHSHNDYWRRVPLFSALRAGCTGVEADVWLFDDDLYVGHNTASLQRNRTFQSLYVNPLVQILKQQNPETDFYNGTSHGVFDADAGKSLVLLVDLKTGGAETWPWVLKQLEPLRERGWLSFVENDTLHTRPITVVGTGNTPFNVLTQNATYRDAFFDAPLDQMWTPRHTTPETKDRPDMDDSLPGERLVEGEGSAEEFLHTSSSSSSANPVSTPSPTNHGQGMTGVSANTTFTPLNSYYASVSFGKAVGHVWRGRLSPRQMKIIRGQIRGAHERGLKARYWDLPSWPIGLRNHVWDVLVKEGVDYLNVDDLRGASKQIW